MNYRAAMIAILALFSVCGISHAQDMANLGILTGSQTGTYFQIGNNINTLLENVCKSSIEVRPSAGSLDNLRRLRKEQFVQLAIVQHDVLAYVKIFKQDDKEMQEWVDKFRYIFPLYKEEIHIVARRDSNIRTIRDLNNRKVAVGLPDSGTQISAIYTMKLAEVTVYPETVGPDEALGRLFLDKSDPKHLDAFFMTAGKPFKLLTSNDPRLNELTLVGIDDEKVFTLYERAKITRADYAWLDRDVDTAATMSALITFDYRGKNCDNVAMVARQIENNLEELQKSGHQKWNEVRLKDTIPGWERYQCVTQRLTSPIRGCRFEDQVPPQPSVSKRCENLVGKEKVMCEISK